MRDEQISDVRQTSKSIKDLISDCLFIMPEINPAAVPIKSNKIEGWISSCKLPYANRVRLKSFNDIRDAVALTVSYFRDRKTPFTWVVGEYEKSLNLSDYLIEEGFNKSMYPSVAGMYFNINQLDLQHQVHSVIETAPDFMENHMNLIAEGFDLSSDLARFLFNKLVDNGHFQPKSYFSKYKSSDQIVGYGASVLMAERAAVLLRGSCVLHNFRQCGVYESLVIARLIAAKLNGSNLAITHSARHSSYSSLKRLGFIEATAFDFYEWGSSARF